MKLATAHKRAGMPLPGMAPNDRNALRAMTMISAGVDEQDKATDLGGRMVMGDEEDAATAEMEWTGILKGIQHADEDNSLVQRKGLTAKQYQQQQAKSAALLKSTKAANARSLFKMVIGSQIVQVAFDTQNDFLMMLA